jgi:cyclophilin family peptidyl-prolyl cis-trans isomerase
MKIPRTLLGIAVCSISCLIAAGPAAAAADQPGTTPPPAPTPAPATQPTTTPETKPTPVTPPATPGVGTPDTKPMTPPASSAAEKLAFVKLATSHGDILLELNNEKAPISTRNFLSYVDKRHYDGTIFHRVIGDFMIQGGGFGPDMKELRTDAPIKNEWQNGLKNAKYTLAMARTSAPDSATSQFFINVGDNTQGKRYDLDTARGPAAYAVFGRVVAGQDVVDKIKAVKTATKGGHENVPVEPVTITTATRVPAAEAQGMIKAPAAPHSTPDKK